MTLNELKDILFNYDVAITSDEYSSVIFGCDCGCGGDFYKDNPEAWDNMLKENDAAIAKTKAMCEELGVEYDGV